MDNLKLQKNIKLLYIHKALRSLFLLAPVTIPFFYSRWLDMQEIFLLQSFFSVAIVLFELPTWYIADKVWRKVSMLLWSILFVFSMIRLLFAHWFFELLIMEVLVALSWTLYSGADTALLYDSLLSAGRESEYKSIKWKFHSLGMLFLAMSWLIWGWLAWFDLLYVVIGTAVVGAIALPSVLWLYEPDRHKLDTKESYTKQISKIVKYSLHGHKEIKWLMLFGAVMGATVHVGLRLFQPYLTALGMPLELFWVFFTAFTIFWAFFWLIVDRIEKMIWKRRSLLLLFFLAVVLLWLIGLWVSYLILLLFVGFQFHKAFQVIVLHDYINKLVWSEMRATVLSINKLLYRFVFAILGPIVWYFHDAISIQSAFQVTALFALLFWGIALYKLKIYKAL